MGEVLSRDEVASKLSDFFDREVDAGEGDEPGDLLVVRYDPTTESTIAVTSFGNKVSIGEDGEVELLQGPREQALEPISASTPVTVADEPADLAPLEGTPEDAGGDSYEDWNKDQLSEALEARGLPKSGTKDELIARLEEDDAAEDDETDEDDDEE